MNEIIRNSIFGRDERLIDRRIISVNINFSSATLEFLDDIFKWFIEPFEKEYILDISTSQRNSVGSKNLKDIVKKTLDKRGYECICYDGIVKSAKMQTKKAYKEFLYPPYGAAHEIAWEAPGENIYWVKKLKDLEKNLEAKDINQYYRTLIGKIIDLEADDKDYLTSFHDTDFGLIFRIGHIKKYYCTLIFDVYLYSVGKNINKLIDKLWDICKTINSKYDACKGHIALNCKKNLQFDSQIMEYFNDYPDGAVWDPTKRRRYDVRAWMESNYINGIEWANVLPKKIAEKIQDFDQLKLNPNYDVEKEADGSVFIKSVKDIREFNSKDIESCYDNLKNCLCPGRSERYVFSMRRYGENIYIPPTEYLVDGPKVYFKRGSFDFITKGL